MNSRPRQQIRNALVCLLFAAIGSVAWEAGAFACGTKVSPKVETVLDPNSLPPGIALEDVPRAKERAMEGSPDAAAKLARFYGERDDLKDKIFWLTIAVENGDAEQQLWLARVLWLDESDPLNIIRSRYWYNRIIKSASPEISAFAEKELAAQEKYRKEFPPNTRAN